MHRDHPELHDGKSSDAAEARLRRKRKGALDLLLEARDKLVSQLCDDVLSSRDLILDSSADGLFSFEFQEIEDRYSARLHAINSLLENLEFRRPRIVHRVETLRSTVGALKDDMNALVEQFDEWDLVAIEVTPMDGDEVLVVLGFTNDEYMDG